MLVNNLIYYSIIMPNKINTKKCKKCAKYKKESKKCKKEINKLIIINKKKGKGKMSSTIKDVLFDTLLKETTLKDPQSLLTLSDEGCVNQIGWGGQDQTDINIYNYLKVEKVFECQNKHLTQIYESNKELIRHKCDYFKKINVDEFKSFKNPPNLDKIDTLDDNINEVLLYHGTNGTALPNILQNGMNEHYSTNDAFGFGIYMADNFVKSDQYCSEANNEEWKALCKIINNSITDSKTNALHLKSSCPITNGLGSDPLKTGIHYMLICKATLGNIIPLTTNWGRGGKKIVSIKSPPKIEKFKFNTINGLDSAVNQIMIPYEEQIFDSLNFSKNIKMIISNEGSPMKNTVNENEIKEIFTNNNKIIIKLRTEINLQEITTLSKLEQKTIEDIQRLYSKYSITIIPINNVFIKNNREFETIPNMKTPYDSGVLDIFDNFQVNLTDGDIHGCIKTPKGLSCESCPKNMLEPQTVKKDNRFREIIITNKNSILPYMLICYTRQLRGIISVVTGFTITLTDIITQIGWKYASNRTYVDLMGKVCVIYNKSLEEKWKLNIYTVVKSEKGIQITLNENFVEQRPANIKTTIVNGSEVFFFNNEAEAQNFIERLNTNTETDA